MDIELNDIELRVLGSLLEKSMTTPEYYPLSLNALTLACNQKSSREPVVAYDETTVVRALDSLREKRLVLQSGATRVPRYEELFVKARNLEGAEAAILTVIILRGPQTPGEIKIRSERMHSFASLEELQETLATLEEVGLVVKLPRQPGRKESRYAHLLAGEPVVEEQQAPAELATRVVRAENERLAQLEAEVGALRQELDQLRQEFGTFRQQFD